MITDDLFELIPEKSRGIILSKSISNGCNEMMDTDIVDFIYDSFGIEIRPRVYKGDYGERLWCVEVYDWYKTGDNHLQNLVGYRSRQEAVHKALVWFWTELYVKNS